MNPPRSAPIASELQPLPALLYRHHAILLLPRGGKWEVRTTYISPVCLAPLFSSLADAFSRQKRG